MRDGGPSPRRVTLVDDVCTTGATLRDCARAVARLAGRVEQAVVVAVTKSQHSWRAPTHQTDAAGRALFAARLRARARGIGSTAPIRPSARWWCATGRSVGEGVHRRAGAPHAEADALAAAGARGARRDAVRIARTVLRTSDARRRAPRPDRSAGSRASSPARADPKRARRRRALLESRGVDVAVADDAAARELIEMFAATIAAAGHTSR